MDHEQASEMPLIAGKLLGGSTHFYNSLCASNDQVPPPTPVRLPFPSTQIGGDRSNRDKVMLVPSRFRGPG